MVRSLTNRRIPRPLAVLLAMMLALYWVPTLAITPANAAPAGSSFDPQTFDQCENGTGSATDCADGWTNGALNAQNSHYHEDEVVPQRLQVSFATAGTHTVTLSYLARNKEHHAYDSLATWNHTVTGADRCQALPNGAPCIGGNPTTFPIPADSTVVGTTSPDATSSHQLTGQVMTMYGGTLTGISAPTHSSPTSGTSDYASVVVTFTTANDGDAVELLFGGHLATSAGPRGWGAGLGAGDISGSPYHIMWIATDGKDVSSRDNQIQAGAILPPAGATIATSATASVTIGSAISDTATVTPSTAEGTVTFKAYGPDDATCSATPAFTSTPVTLSGGTATSPDFTPNAVGTYRWIASFTSADSGKWTSVSGKCNDAGESSVVTKKQPTISTSATPEATLPSASIHDVATVSGLTSDATGKVTFSLFDNNTCTGTAVWTNEQSLGSVSAGQAVATSDDHVVTQAGTYYWIASYGGDAKNASVSGKCGDANESSTVDKANATITTDASDTAKLPDATVSDTATLGGVTADAGGTIVFRLYGPDATPADPTCTDGEGGNLVFTSAAVAVDGPGSYGPVSTTVDKAGTYFWVATYSGDANNNGVSGVCGERTETSSVDKASTTIETSATSTDLPAGSVHDTATVSGLTKDATGSVTFNLYGPSETADCSGTPVYTDTESLGSVTAGVATVASGSYTPTQAGRFWWVASYSGDGNNNAATGACGDKGETSTVNPATTAISTTATSAELPSGTVHDTATVSGLTSTATGTVTFALYGPSATADCSGNPVFTSSTPLGTVSNGTATVTSGSFTADSAGKYWWVASYSGDANNAKASGQCGDPGETSTVSPATPAISTDAYDDSLPVGHISDSAQLSGLTADATGTVTFRVYGPSATADCSGDPLWTSDAVAISAVVGGKATAFSGTFTVAKAGQYWWVASYSGDANNAKVSGQCGDPGETSTVSPASPEITTQAYDDRLPVGHISDSAYLTGLTADAKGTVTFSVWGPSEQADCTGDPLWTSDAVAIGDVTDGQATAFSGTFTASQVGSYWWIASYSGDANNNAVAGTCGDPHETSTVSRARPEITTQVPAASLTLTADGAELSDSAQLSGATADASGFITFTLYGPFASQDAITCDGEGMTVGDAVSVDGSGTYGSDSITVPAAGWYTWTATYSGDANNRPATHACGLESETVHVLPAETTVTTNAVSEAVIKLGQSVTDTATVSGVTPSATGTVTFSLYGPNDDSCTGDAVFTDSQPLTVDGSVGTATSAPFAPTVAGTYRWVASYSGDADNAASAGACNDPNEQSVVFAGDVPGLDKAADPVSGSTVGHGDVIDYTLTVANTGDYPVSGPVVDTLPSYVTLVPGSVSDGGVVSADGTTITWDVTLQPKESLQLTYQVKVDADAPAGAELLNTAVFQDITKTTTHTVGVPVPTLTKTADPASGTTVQPGQQITYTVTVGNSGTYPVSGDVVDTLPAHVTLVDGSISDSGVVADGTITWSVTLAPGATKTLTYAVTVDADAPAGASLVNRATFQGLEATTTHTVASGDLVIGKAVSPGTGAVVKFGDTLTYTLTVTSRGELDQQGVQVTDYLPGYDPARPSSGKTTYVAGSAACDGTCTATYDASTHLLTWALGDMAAGTTRTVTFKVTIDTPAKLADGSIPAVDILNAGAVESLRVPKTPSNEVKTPVTTVLPEKLTPPPSVLPHTGLGAPIMPAAATAILLIGIGVALTAAVRRRED